MREGTVVSLRRSPQPRLAGRLLLCIAYREAKADSADFVHNEGLRASKCTLELP